MYQSEPRRVPPCRARHHARRRAGHRATESGTVPMCGGGDRVCVCVCVCVCERERERDEKREEKKQPRSSPRGTTRATGNGGFAGTFFPLADVRAPPVVHPWGVNVGVVPAPPPPSSSSSPAFWLLLAAVAVVAVAAATVATVAALKKRTLSVIPCKPGRADKLVCMLYVFMASCDHVEESSV
jgi:hypothetical protein